MKRFVLSLVLAGVILVASLGASVQPVSAQGCPNGSVNCDYILQVCDASGCYWITQCVGSDFIYAHCTPIRSGCRFEWCGYEPVVAGAERRLPKVSQELLDAAAAIDPFAALGLSNFEGVSFKGEQKYKFVAYKFPTTESAQTYVRQTVRGEFRTRLEAPVHWSEKGKSVQPDTEIVTLRIETPSDKVTLLHAIHGDTILTVKYKQKGDGYRMKLNNNS